MQDPEQPALIIQEISDYHAVIVAADNNRRRQFIGPEMRFVSIRVNVPPG
jgi:hypothetical protein